jgi:hypothetical protein
MSYEHDGVVYGDFLSQGGLFANGIVQNASDAAGNYLYVNDFLKAADLDLTNDWTATDVGVMTLDPSVFIATDVAGGVLRIDSDATDGDGNHLQYTAANGGGEFILPAASQVHAALFRCTHEDWDANHWFFGISETSATFMDADGDIAASLELAGFFHNADDHGDGVPRLYAAGGNNTKVTTTAGERAITAFTDSTYVELGIRIVGTDRVEWYVDGALRGKAQLASAFTSNMCITLASVMNTATGDAVDTDLIVAAGNRAA